MFPKQARIYHFLINFLSIFFLFPGNRGKWIKTIKKWWRTIKHWKKTRDIRHFWLFPKQPRIYHVFINFFIDCLSIFYHFLASVLSLFAAKLVLRLSPPSHRTALCSSGGRGACAATSVPPLPFRSPLSCGGAFWQGDKVIQFIDRKFPSSGIIRRC